MAGRRIRSTLQHAAGPGDGYLCLTILNAVSAWSSKHPPHSALEMVGSEREEGVECGGVRERMWVGE